MRREVLYLDGAVRRQVGQGDDGCAEQLIRLSLPVPVGLDLISIALNMLSLSNATMDACWHDKWLGRFLPKLPPRASMFSERE